MIIHMDDIAGAMYAVSQRGTANAIYPIGSGEAKPLYEYIKIMCGILGEDWKKSIGKVSYSENQVMYLSADISELTRDTGWKPQIAFEDGIRQVIEFYRTWRDDQ